MSAAVWAAGSREGAARTHQRVPPTGPIFAPPKPGPVGGFAMSFRYVFFDQRSADVNHPMRDRKDDLKNDQKNDQRVPAKTGTRRSHEGAAQRGVLRGTPWCLQGVGQVPMQEATGSGWDAVWVIACTLRHRLLAFRFVPKNQKCCPQHPSETSVLSAIGKQPKVFFLHIFWGRYFDLRQRRNEDLRLAVLTSSGFLFFFGSTFVRQNWATWLRPTFCRYLGSLPIYLKQHYRKKLST